MQTLNTDQKLKSIGDLFSKKNLTAEAKDELEKYIKDRTRDDLISRTGNKKKSKSYVFQKFKAIRSFGRHNYGGVIMLNDAFEEQINPKIRSMILMNILNQKARIKKKAKILTYENAERLLKQTRNVLNGSGSKIFQIEKQTQGKGVKIITRKQMLQRLPTALSQLKASNTSKNVLNGIRKIIYSLYRSKEITKNVYNNIMNSTKLTQNKWCVYEF